MIINHLRGLVTFWRLGLAPMPTESGCLQKLNIGCIRKIIDDCNVKLSLESRVPSQGHMSD